MHQVVRHASRYHIRSSRPPARRSQLNSGVRCLNAKVIDMYPSVVGRSRQRLAPWAFGALSTALFFAAAGQVWLYLVYGRGLPTTVDVAKWVPIAWRAVAGGWLAALATFVLVDRSRVPWRVPVASAFA